MNEYRPLSKRGVPTDDLDTLHDQLEPWMQASLLSWGARFWWTHGEYSSVSDTKFVNALERQFRLREPFQRGRVEVAKQLEDRMKAHRVFGMDVIDFCLSYLSETVPSYANAAATELNGILRQCGSAWQVSQREDAHTDRTIYFLARRDLEAAKNAIDEIRATAARPGEFLADAWRKLASREPDPNGAYDKAIKATEAAAQPVISPKNNKATLGTILRDLNAKPEKWKFALGKDLDTVISMADRLWTNHFRHGTQPRSDHTFAEADAAVHLAIPLVRAFVGGLVTEDDSEV
jgi:hypothetical protein